MDTFFVDSDGTEYVVIDEIHTNVTGPNNTKISVKVFETINKAFIFNDSIDFKFFLVAEGSYKWAEITKNEFIALRILKKVGDRKISTILYEREQKKIEINRFFKESKCCETGWIEITRREYSERKNNTKTYISEEE